MTRAPLRAVLWQRRDVPGMERCELALDPDGGGWRLSGTVLVGLDGLPAELSYRVLLGSDWTTREVLVRRGTGPSPWQLRLAIAPVGGGWVEERTLPDGGTASRTRAELRGLVDADLGFTPATNTLPIRRLGPAIGEAVEVTAAWVRFPELTVEPLPQRYVRLGERRYRYESAGGAFTAELEVDDFGLVVRYGELWERVAESGFRPGMTPPAAER